MLPHKSPPTSHQPRSRGVSTCVCKLSHHIEDGHHQYQGGGRHGEDQSQPGIVGDDNAGGSGEPGKRAEGAFSSLLRMQKWEGDWGWAIRSGVEGQKQHTHPKKTLQNLSRDMKVRWIQFKILNLFFYWTPARLFRLRLKGETECWKQRWRDPDLSTVGASSDSELHGWRSMAALRTSSDPTLISAQDFLFVMTH